MLSATVVAETVPPVKMIILTAVIIEYLLGICDLHVLPGLVPTEKSIK